MDDTHLIAKYGKNIFLLAKQICLEGIDDNIIDVCKAIKSLERANLHNEKVLGLISNLRCQAGLATPMITQK